MSESFRPNLLLITTDQQRFDTVRPCAPAYLQTPHIDYLQDQGIDFQQAYAETPICVPTRANLLLGQSGFTHGLTHNGPTTGVLERDSTLPARLSRVGYSTAAIGKLHFTPERARHGFDETSISDDYYRWIRNSGSLHQPMRHGMGQNELYPTQATVPADLTLTSWTAEESVRYIRDRRDPTVPFFLWTSFSKPHPPFDPPEPYASMYSAFESPTSIRSDWSEADDCPAAFRRQRDRGAFNLMPEGAIEQAWKAYLGLITHIDHVMGRIFSALQDMNLLDTTSIVFTSDHGEFLGDHATGNKVMWHEPSARVPLVVRPAPALGLDHLAGTTSTSLVTHVDVTRTLLDQGGAKGADSCGENLIEIAAAGRSQRTQLFGIATELGSRPSEPQLLYLSVYDGRWKYIWYPEGAAEQLFDLATDPDETHNVAMDEESESTRSRLHEHLREHVEASAPRWLVDGRLPIQPLKKESRSERRLKGWPGYHTEFYDQDVRH